MLLLSKNIRGPGFAQVAKLQKYGGKRELVSISLQQQRLTASCFQAAGLAPKSSQRPHGERSCLPLENIWKMISCCWNWSPKHLGGKTVDFELKKYLIYFFRWWTLLCNCCWLFGLGLIDYQGQSWSSHWTIWLQTAEWYDISISQFCVIRS